MARTLEVDYLVVGAGAMGMAFTDALIDHADVRVALVDRRHEQVLILLLESGLVELLTSSEYADGAVVSRVSGRRTEVADGCRIVDARYLAPSIPAEKPPPFEVLEGARVVPVNALPRLDDVPDELVVAGAGKTATDACIWLLAQGVDPDRITWVRPREPWMFNRAVIQPDPAIFLGMVADLMESARAAESLDDLFLRLEDDGVMLRIDRSRVPTMAKAPTLATWELEQLRTVENVVRHGHLAAVAPGELRFADATVAVSRDAVVVHCAADALKYPPLVPIWGPREITLQPIRAGFPCFGAALAGYVEATRDDDAEKNRLCPPTPYGDSLADWVRMTVLGTRAAASATSAPDVKAWANDVPLNPTRIPAAYPASPALDDARERIATHTVPAIERLMQLV